MALIDTTTLLGIADRAAQQYNILRQGFESADQEGGGWYFDRATTTQDPDIEIPLGQPYQIVDEDVEVDFAIRNGTRMANIVNAMLVHFNVRDSAGNPLQAGGWDGYLASKNVRVSWWFNKLYFAVKQRYLLAINVFSETDDTFGTVEVVSGPGLQFTDGVNYGNGSELNRATGSNFAATQLKVVVGTMGANQLDLRLNVKDINNLPTTIDVSIPASSPPGTEIPVGTSANRYLDMIGVSYIPFSSYGTLGDTVTIHNLKERQIAL
jgi:hypothetical protein